MTKKEIHKYKSLIVSTKTDNLQKLKDSFEISDIPVDFKALFIEAIDSRMNRKLLIGLAMAVSSEISED